MHVFTRACYRRRGHARLNDLRNKLRVLTAVERIILKHIVFIAANGAADELVAFGLIHPRSALVSQVQKVFGLRTIFFLRQGLHDSANHGAEFPG